MTEIPATKRNLPFGKPIIEEEERTAVMDVLAGLILVHGPRATAFEISSPHTPARRRR